MSSCIICSFRKSYLSQEIDSGQHPASFDLLRELDDLHRFSFNSLLTLLAVLTISGSKAMLPVVLALLIYSVSLRLACSPCFIQNYPILSRLLHLVPLLGTFCMAAVQLVLDMRSSALAVVTLLLSVLPFVTTIFHHGSQCEETPLPVRMQDRPSTVSNYSGTGVMQN